MKLLLLYLLGLSSLIHHCLIAIALAIVYVCYKLFYPSPASGQMRPKSPLDRMPANRSILIDRFKGQVERATDKIMGMRSTNRRRDAVLDAALVSVIITLIIFSLAAHNIGQVNGLEQDAKLMQPVANMAKAIINTATLGVPLEFNVNPSDLVKNIAALTWRTGFPVTMPKGFVPKAQDFYNRVRQRVERTSVDGIQRKGLAELKVDLDSVVDSIVGEVRNSSDGVYTDYLKTRVNGVPLEDACTEIGTQLKAYGVDLTNYRNIAGAVLGIPLMPQVASTMVNVANIAQPIHGTLRNVTGNMIRSPIRNMPQVAYNSAFDLTNSFGQSFNNANQFVQSVPGQLTSFMPSFRRQQQQQHQQQRLMLQQQQQQQQQMVPTQA